MLLIEKCHEHISNKDILFILAYSVTMQAAVTNYELLMR